MALVVPGSHGIAPEHKDVGTANRVPCVTLTCLWSYIFRKENNMATDMCRRKRSLHTSAGGLVLL